MEILSNSSHFPRIPERLRLLSSALCHQGLFRGDVLSIEAVTAPLRPEHDLVLISRPGGYEIQVCDGDNVDTAIGRVFHLSRAL